MFKNALKNFFKKPATAKYPCEKPVAAVGFRGEQALNLDLCVGCGLCSRECPSQAIEMVEVNGKKHPMFLLDRCIFCYHCADVCPKKAITRTGTFDMAALNKSSLTLDPRKQKQNKTSA
jgi:formate hydrogenlyase subunit 6/NADH:ubiquinone oxidoreductase subunit I